MTSQSTQRLSLFLFALTAMVVGSMVGSGIFSLPRTFGIATGPFGAIFAWCIAAGGTYTLARVFQALAERKPDMDAGVYAYAKAGFGDYPGFLSALGYWIGSCIGGVELRKNDKPFVDLIAESLGLKKLHVVETGGNDYMRERTQWDSGANLVCATGRRLCL